MEENSLRNLFQLLVRKFGFLDEKCCEKCCGTEISVTQSHILYEIARQDNPSIQDVSKALGTDITTFSRQVKTLVEKEMVKKTQLPHDNRIYTLSLSPKGKVIAESIDQNMNDYLVQILSSFSEFERESIIRSVELLNKAMRNSEEFYPLK